MFFPPEVWRKIVTYRREFEIWEHRLLFQHVLAEIKYIYCDICKMSIDYNPIKICNGDCLRNVCSKCSTSCKWCTRVHVCYDCCDITDQWKCIFCVFVFSYKGFNLNHPDCWN